MRLDAAVSGAWAFCRWAPTWERARPCGTLRPERSQGRDGTPHHRALRTRKRCALPITLRSRPEQGRVCTPSKDGPPRPPGEPRRMALLVPRGRRPTLRGQRVSGVRPRDPEGPRRDLGGGEPPASLPGSQSLGRRARLREGARLAGHRPRSRGEPGKPRIVGETQAPPCEDTRACRNRRPRRPWP